MKQIIIIDDDKNDVEEIKQILMPLKDLDIRIHHIPSLKTAEASFSNFTADLVLLDLEFTAERTTSISFLQKQLIGVPVIVISHLKHYQKQLSQQVDVRAFIRKDMMAQYLVPAVERVLFSERTIEPDSFLIPLSKIKNTFQSLRIHEICYIQKAGRNTYQVYTTDEKVKLIKSVSFVEICDALTRQHITQLQPVSHNQIINTSCIKTIGRTPKGRIFIELINLPGKQFHVGQGYADYFVQTYLKE